MEKTEKQAGVKIKICGLLRPEDVEYANRVKPDFAGFILTPGFRRSITEQQAALYRQRLCGETAAVGVFVDAPWGEAARLLEAGVIQMAQLHGSETERDIRALRAAAGKPVVKAVKVRERRDVEAWLDSAADYLLFDSGMGTGEAFDWSLLEGIRRPYFLAGGLNAGNLAQAVRRLHPYGVDISSGVETKWYKDERKMREAVELVRKL